MTTTDHAFRIQHPEEDSQFFEDIALGCRVCDGPLEDHEWFVWDEDHPTDDAVCTLAPMRQVLDWVMYARAHAI